MTDISCFTLFFRLDASIHPSGGLFDKAAFAKDLYLLFAEASDILIDHAFHPIKPYSIRPISDGQAFDYDLSKKNNIPTILYDIKRKRPERYDLIINTFKDIFPSIEKIDVVEIPIVAKNSSQENIEPSKVAGKFYALIAKDKNLSKPRASFLAKPLSVPNIISLSLSSSIKPFGIIHPLFRKE